MVRSYPSQACYAVPSLEALRSMAGDHWSKYRVVAVDEAQFFPDLFDVCSSTADAEGKLWVLAGLDGDFMRQRFGQVSWDAERKVWVPIDEEQMMCLHRCGGDP